jgi:hypothetical protein
METSTVAIKLPVISLSLLTAEERAELMGILAKVVTPIPMLPYGVTTEL